MSEHMITVDGNEAVARVAYAASEVIAIYPITPASSMGELADQWASENKPNLWDSVPRVVEMQSEGGAIGAVHGALQAGALSTTFTSSQGLLLMIPDLFKIAGELTPFVLHVAARALATHALSIFGDHSDVMSARSTGFALLSSASVQEAQDMALIAHAATLEARVPFMHFFDGFRTSHEIAKIELLDKKVIKSLISDSLVRAHRERSLSPDRPFIHGTSQNPDVFFQSREAANPYYLACPEIVQKAMDKFAKLTGRHYHLFEYSGALDAECVIIIMGSGSEAVQETVERLEAEGERVGVLKVHLLRPFSIENFIHALPPTVKSIAVLDRCKEPGASGEPLYQDVVTALNEAYADGLAPFAQMPRVVGGRYGLASKEFTPAMIKAIFDELKNARPKNHFTVGINDDVTHTSLNYDAGFSTEDADTVRAVFYGLGSDGTVGANKNSIKIIGEETENYAQAYFVYDSKKSGSVTVSHLRFGPRPIRSTYLISRANFVACHQFTLMERMDVLREAEEGATFLLNSPYDKDAVWNQLPLRVQNHIIEKQLRFYVINANAVARETGMGGRINTIMQACFFALSGVLPREQAIAKIKDSIKKTYGKRGEAVVQKNMAAVEAALGHMHEVEVPETLSSEFDIHAPVPPQAPAFAQRVLAKIIEGEGDSLPVSAFPVDGSFPSATTQWEKRAIALDIPIWDEDLCIQCGKCTVVCPHAAIRAKVYEGEYSKGAPETFKSSDARFKEFKGQKYTLQVAPDDCTGCNLCVEVCPAVSKTDKTYKAIHMSSRLPVAQTERDNWDFFRNHLPETPREQLNLGQTKDLQLAQPLFEFSGACAGCGETPYIKMLTQLFGDRILVANATGCSSIYGGNLPTTPWATNNDGRGPAWSNSLFEDNAEYGLGKLLATQQQTKFAHELLQKLAPQLDAELVQSILEAPQNMESEINAQRARVETLKTALHEISGDSARNLRGVADALVRKSVWIIGGDGWAYDIDFGGLDHVLASGHNVKVLVLDTEVYSNTGGQNSKATPKGAVAKFAAGGKTAPKKDMAMIAMTYGHIYVARVAFGANDTHTLKVLREAEEFDGPALIIAYGHCIAHSYDMARALDQQKAAVASGYWPLMRFDPSRREQGWNPLQIDSKAPSIPLSDYIYKEGRYTMLAKSNPEAAAELLKQSQREVKAKWNYLQYLAAFPVETDEEETVDETHHDVIKQPAGANNATVK